MKIEDLKPLSNYTLVKFGEFGFPFAVAFQLVEIRKEKYAQYLETFALVFKQKGKRKLRGLRIIPDHDRYMIWEGFQSPNVSMYQSTTPDEFGALHSFLPFSESYLNRAKNSVSITPIIDEGEPIIPAERETA